MRSLVNWTRAGTADRIAGAWGFILVVVLAQVAFSPAVAQFSLNLRAGGAPSTGSVDYSAAWNAVDAEADLTGFWGSIDPALDKDPFLFTDAASGRYHLVWAQWSGTYYRVVHAQRSPGLSWEGPEAVEPNPGSTLNNITPRGMVDGQGLLHVTWARVGSAAGFIYHAVRVSGGWAAAGLISGSDSDAAEPLMWQEQGATLLDYTTSSDLVHIEVDVVGYTGGSDDVDPTEITVDSWEIGRSIIPK